LANRRRGPRFISRVRLNKDQVEKSLGVRKRRREKGIEEGKKMRGPVKRTEGAANREN